MAAAPRPPKEPAFEREKSLGFVVNHLARLFARALEQALAPHGVAPGQFAFLVVLWEEEGLTQSEIARRLDLEQPTAANTLRRLQRDGLVVSSPSPRNRREVLFFLSAAGRALEARVTAEASAVNARAAAPLTAAERATFFVALDKMRAALTRA